MSMCNFPVAYTLHKINVLYGYDVHAIVDIIPVAPNWCVHSCGLFHLVYEHALFIEHVKPFQLWQNH